MRLPLDQNFPEPILEGLQSWMGDVQLVPLRTIDHRLTTLDDRELLIALKQLGYEGLVTLNYRMLRNPKELAAVLKTKLAIFAVEAGFVGECAGSGRACQQSTRTAPKVVYRLHCRSEAWQ